MDDYLQISALQHCAYCPRQFALIHLEQAWAENRYTAEGQLLHQRVDSGEKEVRGPLRRERSVNLVSHNLGIRGRLDLLEIEALTPPKYFPIEYKRGKPKKDNWDCVQLCAQALCIEEMRQVDVKQGAIWYWEVRRREPVIIDSALREQTLTVIEAATQILRSKATPMPTSEKSRCRACSLKNLCLPDVIRNDWTNSYIEDIGG